MGLRSFLGQAVVLVLAWVGLLAWQQDSLIYHPVRYTRKDPDVKAMTAFFPDFDLQELRFSTADGNQTAIILKKHGYYADRLYLVFGGNAMVARDWVEVFVHPQFDMHNGLALALVDFPGYGESDGAPSKASIVRVGKRALLEATRVLLHRREGVDLFVGAIGHSIGCSAALELAVVQQGTRTPVRHVVLSAPFTTLAEMASEMLPVLKAIPVWLIAALTARNSWDNTAAAKQLSGATTPQVDIMHGKRDSMVPHAMGERLSRRLRALGFQVSFQSIESDHNDLVGSEGYAAWLHRALARRT